MSEANWPESPQDNYFADICITAMLKMLRRVRKNESQANLRGNPFNTVMALFLTISIPLGVSDIASTKAVFRYQTSSSAVFSKIQTGDAIVLNRGPSFFQSISVTPLRKLTKVLRCIMCNCFYSPETSTIFDHFQWFKKKKGGRRDLVVP